jgi:hypothetical protein
MPRRKTSEPISFALDLRSDKVLATIARQLRTMTGGSCGYCVAKIGVTPDMLTFELRGIGGSHGDRQP